MNPTSLLPLPIIGITEQFYNSATLETLIRPSIIVNFNTGIEVDLVDRAFAERHALKTAFFSAPKLSVLGGGQISPTKVVYISLTMMDSKGSKQTFSRSCMVVDYKGGSPILFLITTLSDESIHIEPLLRKC